MTAKCANSFVKSHIPNHNIIPAAGYKFVVSYESKGSDFIRRGDLLVNDISILHVPKPDSAIPGTRANKQTVVRSTTLSWQGVALLAVSLTVLVENPKPTVLSSEPVTSSGRPG